MCGRRLRVKAASWEKGPGSDGDQPTHFSPNFMPCTPNIEFLEIKGRQGKVPALGCLMYWGSQTSKPKGVTPHGVSKEWVSTRHST